MGKLIVVGTGIKSLAHMTEEVKVVIKSVEHCLFLVTENHLKSWIKQQSRGAESLERFFDKTKKRIDIYRDIGQYIVQQTEKYETMCVIFYGHPVFFASSALDAVNEHRKNNKEAIILPAISCVDSMWADLCIDPGADGCSIFEATDFLVNNRIFDKRSNLVLLQIGVIGGDDLQLQKNVDILKEYLEKFYPYDHDIILYEAAIIPGQRPIINKIKICELTKVMVSKIATLYIPPYKKSNNT